MQGRPGQILRFAGSRPGPPRASVATLTYTSTAAGGLDPVALAEMLSKAKARNRRVGVSGMLLASENKFFQWLEGPPDSVEALWADIRRDQRHQNVELIDHYCGPMRLFGEWDMKFVCREPALGMLHDQTDPSEAAPPGLVNHTAELALKGDSDSLVEGLEELMLMGRSLLTLHGSVVEPAARRLGDWWREDRIGEIEVALGLSYLQSAVRRAGLSHPQTGARASLERRILIAVPPGESHILGGALMGDVFRDAGWRVTIEFPEKIEDLAASVRADRYQVLALCLSDAVDRLERSSALSRAISAARAASANPSLSIIAGGRVFKIHPGLAAALGADAVFCGAAHGLAKAGEQAVLGNA